jgi:hypothetical protein
MPAASVGVGRSAGRWAQQRWMRSTKARGVSGGTTGASNDGRRPAHTSSMISSMDLPCHGSWPLIISHARRPKENLLA